MTTPTRARHRRPTPPRDGGWITLELVLYGTLIVGLIALMAAGGRIALAQGSLEQVADDAARAASLARTSAAAQSNAEDLVQQTLAIEGVDCSSYSTAVDTAAFALPAGASGSVSVTVTCTVTYLDYAGFAASFTLTADASSVLDEQMERG